MQGIAVHFDQVVKTFGSSIALEDFTLHIQPGEFVTLLGASGSGKSTALNILAGFSDATSGDVRIGDKSMAGVPSEDRNVGMVFQSFALFPHMTVFDNVAFPLKMRRVPAQQIRAKVNAALEMVQLSQFADRRPAALSGGQRQRVALARAVVFEPPVLLMDECLSALDLKLREELQSEIRRIHDKIGATTVFVTHDQGEALTMSDRVAVLNKGRIEQIDIPSVLYDRPATRFVADFIGRTNLIKAEKTEAGLRIPGIDALLNREVDPHWISLRPERLARAEMVVDGENKIKFGATLESSVFQGGYIDHQFRLTNGTLLNMREGRSSAFTHLEPGGTFDLAFQRDDAVVLADQ